MENVQLRAYQIESPIGQLKDSIRDMIRLQRDYQLSDELFWEVFNARVLLNEQIDVDEFVSAQNMTAAYA